MRVRLLGSSVRQTVFDRIEDLEPVLDNVPCQPTTSRVLLASAVTIHFRNLGYDLDFLPNTPVTTAF